MPKRQWQWWNLPVETITVVVVESPVETVTEINLPIETITVLEPASRDDHYAGTCQ
jgi:hypothetical protein